LIACSFTNVEIALPTTITFCGYVYIRNQVINLYWLGEAGLISHLALCGLSACIGLRYLIVLALAEGY